MAKLSEYGYFSPTKYWLLLTYLKLYHLIESCKLESNAISNYNSLFGKTLRHLNNLEVKKSKIIIQQSCNLNHSAVNYVTLFPEYLIPLKKKINISRHSDNLPWLGTHGAKIKIIEPQFIVPFWSYIFNPFLIINLDGRMHHRNSLYELSILQICFFIKWQAM